MICELTMGIDQVEFEHKVVSTEETSAVSSTSSLTSRLSFQLQETARGLADPISCPMLDVSGSWNPPAPCLSGFLLSVLCLSDFEQIFHPRWQRLFVCTGRTER